MQGFADEMGFSLLNPLAGLVQTTKKIGFY